MRTIHTTIVGAVIALMAALMPASISAQGKMAVGGKLGYVSENKSMDIAALFQYSITPELRLAPDLGFTLRHDGVDAFFINCNMHYNLDISSDQISLYPLAGLNFTSWGAHHTILVTEPSISPTTNIEAKYSKHFPRLGLNLGAGFEYYAKPNIKILAEWKYTFAKDFSHMTLEAGAAYIF